MQRRVLLGSRVCASVGLAGCLGAVERVVVLETTFDGDHRRKTATASENPH